MLYEQVVFLQDENAREALSILDDQGEDAAFEHLKQWHYPGEHETRPATSSVRNDYSRWYDDYRMTWNPYIGYIGLEFIIKED